MKIITNERMKDVLNKKRKNELIISAVNFEALVNPEFVEEYDCIIANGEKPNVSYEEFNDIVKKHYFDKKGYEHSRTETLINMYLENSRELSASDMAPVAFSVINIWASHLKLKDSEGSYCFTVSCSDNYVTMRYYKLRENESLIEGDIEKFDQPVAYVIC